jgi:hypothetical protein
MHVLLAAVATLARLALSADDARVAQEAAVVLRSSGGEVVEGEFVLVIRASQYAELRADSDLGPFLGSAAKHEDALVVVVVPQETGLSRAVFFADARPTSWSTVPSDVPVARRAGLAEANRKPVFLPSPKPTWRGCFLDNTVTTDDGKDLPAAEVVDCP